MFTKISLALLISASLIGSAAYAEGDVEEKVSEKVEKVSEDSKPSKE